jgi:nitrogen fixation protein NifB
VTVNAVDPKIGANVYSWMRIGKRVLGPEQGAGTLWEHQEAAIIALKERGILVKVNAIILPGINDTHIPAIAKAMGELGVDLFNCMPYYPNKGSALEHLKEPDPQRVAAIRRAAGAFVPQMGHCTRCRADAVGLLGEAPSESLMNTLKNCRHLSAADPAPARRISSRPYVAVASMEGMLVNQHLGEAGRLLIYGEKEGRLALIEARTTPAAGSGMIRWQQLAECLADCRTLLVSGVGQSPEKVLTLSGVAVVTCEGLIDEAVRRVYAGESLAPMGVRRRKACGVGCGGNGMGCGA